MKTLYTRKDLKTMALLFVFVIALCAIANVTAESQGEAAYEYYAPEYP
jgi:hypothetical protein